VIAAGGALGAVARFAVSRALPTVAGHFPWATFIVNVSGSMALGVVLVAASGARRRHLLLRRLVGTGVIGAYTTYSTFAVESVLLARRGQVAAAVLYVVASVAAAGVGGALSVVGTRAAFRHLRIRWAR